MGAGHERHRRAPAPAAARRHRLVHGQSRRLLVLAHALGQGFPRRGRLAALLLGRLAGREQPLRGQRAPVRLAARHPDPGPAPHLVPVHGRGEPARVPRLRAVGAAHSRAAQRGRARGGGRPASHRDGPPVRASADPPRHRRAAAALDAHGDLRRGAERQALPRTSRRGCRRARAARRGPSAGADRGRHDDPGGARTRARPRLRGRRRRRGLRAHRFLPRPPRHARRLSARRPQRGHGQPGPSGWRGVRAPAGGPRRRRRAGRARDLWRAPLAHRRLPRRDRQHAGIAASARDRDAGGGPGARALRLGRQPGAVGARRRGARARARAASSCACRSTCT